MRLSCVSGSLNLLSICQTHGLLIMCSDSFQCLQTIRMTEDYSVYFVDRGLSVSLSISLQAKLTLKSISLRSDFYYKKFILRNNQDWLSAVYT